jgi:hypothetical protein
MDSMLFSGQPITSATLRTMFEEQTEVFDNSDGYIVDPDYPGKSGFYYLNALVDQTHYKESVDVSKLFFDGGNNASSTTPGASPSNSRPRSTRNKRAARPQPYTHNRLPSQESGAVPMPGSTSTQPSYTPGASYPQGPHSSAQLSYISDVPHLQGPPNSIHGFEQQFYMPSGGHLQGPPSSGEAYPYYVHAPPSIPQPQNIHASPYSSNQNVSYTSFESIASGASSVGQETHPQGLPSSTYRFAPSIPPPHNTYTSPHPTFPNSQPNISLPELKLQFPKYSTLLPHIYNTATTLSLVLDDNHDWLTQSEPDKPSQLLGYARLAVEAVVNSHLSKPKGVDITHEGKFRVATLLQSGN